MPLRKKAAPTLCSIASQEIHPWVEEKGHPLLDGRYYSPSVPLGRYENGGLPALSRRAPALPQKCFLHAPQHSQLWRPPDTGFSLFQHKQGKVGPDGKELIPQESPRVGCFGFVATPSPAPGKTWAVSPDWTGRCTG